MSNKDGGQRNMRFAKPSNEWDAFILTSGYGFRRDPATGKLAWHGGLDKSRWDIRGKPIILSKDAVIRIRSDYYGEIHADSKEGGEYIAHVYGHMMNIPSHVKRGITLKKGAIIGHVNNKGYSTGDHIHFGLVDMFTGKTLNPDLHWEKEVQPKPEAGVYIVQKGGWRSQVIQEMINVGIYKGTWQDNLQAFNALNPITPKGGWRRGDRVLYKRGSTPQPPPKPDKRYYTVKKGGWRSEVIQEMIEVGIYKGTWQDNIDEFNKFNPVTPKGGWKKGAQARWA